MASGKILSMSFNEKSHYANNSSFQKEVIEKVKPMLEETIKEMGKNGGFPECFKMADLGCSSGPNTLFPTVNVINAVNESCRSRNADVPEFQAFLNDLPDNDFNAVFRTLPSFRKNLEEVTGLNGKDKKYKHCCIAAVPGSFYDRLFPSNSLHLVHSSYSLHWLSQAPEGIEKMNKRGLAVGQSSPPEVIEAYAKQYEKDLTTFLRYRAEELKPGGRMVFALHGRGTQDHTQTPYFVDPLTEALLQFVSQGVIEEKKVESLNLPSYAPHKDEMKNIIETEGSFTLDRLEVFEMNWNDMTGDADAATDPVPAAAKFITKTIRAVSEPVVASHFGESVVDPVFLKYEEIVGQRLVNEDKAKLKLSSIAVCLTKREGRT
ncbi:unnamed protein product [Cuscuta epithymum]|uniref:Uncharacterized protein n=1 Tax=Cuscuta epithymum TaxID=186058 RepID=A0AAV0EV67_9ASTE|nr:unnamed protein product [Cuscuta epithymum]